MSNSVIASNYDLTGNGKKITKLANGWLVAIALNNSTLQVYVSQDDNASWTPLCSISSVDSSPAIVSVGNICYVFYTYGDNVYVNSFDATVQANININAYKVIVEAVADLKKGLSAAVDDNGTVYVACSCKTDSYPDTYNIRYSYSSDGITWSGVQFTTAPDTSTGSYQNPFILIFNGIPFIMFDEYSFSSHGIKWGYNGNFDLMNYVLSSSLLDNFTAVISSSGIATLFCSNIYTGSNTSIQWQSYNLTTGSDISHGSYNPNTKNQQKPSAEITGNAIYLYFEGIDTVVSTTKYLIRRIVIMDGVWGEPTNVEIGITYNSTLVKTLMIANKIYYVWNESSAGVKSNVYVFDAFPSAPTNLRVDNFDSAYSSLFNWTYYSDSGNNQYAFRLQVVAVTTGSIVFDTGKSLSPYSEYGMAPNVLTNGSQYLWKVTVWDTLDIASPESGYATVYVFASPTVTITVPVEDNDIYGLQNLTVEWNYGDPSGKSQKAYQVKLYDSSDYLLFDTGKILDVNARSKLLNYTLITGTTYKVGVYVWNIYDIVSDEEIRVFTTDFSLPPRSILVVNRVKDSLLLAWTTQDQSSGQPDIDHYRIWKGESLSTVLYKDNITQQELMDYQVANGIPYYYSIEAVSVTGSKSMSDVVMSAAKFTNLYIVNPSTGESVQLVAGLEFDNASLDRRRAELEPLYSPYSIVVYGGKKARKGTVSATIVPIDRQTPLEAYRVFENLVNGEIKTVLTMKKSNGEIMVVDIFNLTEKEERVSKYKNCTFEFLEVEALPWI